MLFSFSSSVHIITRLNFGAIFNKLGVSLVQGRKGKGKEKSDIRELVPSF